MAKFSSSHPERRWLIDLLNDSGNQLADFCDQLRELEQLGREVYQITRSQAHRKSNSKIDDAVLGELDHEIRHQDGVRKARPNQEFEKLGTAINIYLQKYSSFPKLAFNTRARHWYKSQSWEDDFDVAKEYQAIEYLLQLVRQGKLNLIRRCNNPTCKRWFVARSRHGRSRQVCCSTKCRKLVMRQDPKWKKGHAKYMRDFRKTSAAKR